MSATHDLRGRPYAKLSELKAGDQVELDEGFTCHKAGFVTLKDSIGFLYFECDEGEHCLQGQADDGEHLVGIYKGSSK